MITNYFLQFIDNIMFYVFSFFGEVSLPDIFSTNLLKMVQYYNTAIDTLPYLQLPMQVFVYTIIPFEIGLLLLKVFAGSRTPTN